MKNDQKSKAHPPESPLNGGIIQHFPSLFERCRFTAGRVFFIRHPEASYSEAVRILSTQSVIARPHYLKSWQSDESSLYYL
jgi:hypothetical protein